MLSYPLTLRLAIVSIGPFGAGGPLVTVEDADGEALGTLAHDDLRSVWRAAFNVEDPVGRPVARITERQPWLKLLEGSGTGSGSAGPVPLLGTALGLLKALLINPTYELEMSDGRRAYLRKRPSLLEGRFVLEPEGKLTEQEEAVLVPGTIMMVLLERYRG